MSDHTSAGGHGEGEKFSLPKPPLFTSDYIAMAEILEFDMDRFGKLVLALMYYTMDGTIPDDLKPGMKSLRLGKRPCPVHEAA